MPYCVEADVRLYAPQAVAGHDFAPMIAQQDGLIDSRLRAAFDVPLATVPQLVRNISAMLVAGRYLEASYSALNKEPPEYAGKLVKDAMSELQTVVNDPSLLGLPRRLETALDEDNNIIVTTESTGGMFQSPDPRDWR